MLYLLFCFRDEEGTSVLLPRDTHASITDIAVFTSLSRRHRMFAQTRLITILNPNAAHSHDLFQLDFGLGCLYQHVLQMEKQNVPSSTAGKKNLSRQDSEAASVF